MNIYIEKIVNSIKNSTKPSGKIINKIELDKDIITKYKCTDALTVCYMIAKNMNNIPKCLMCDNDVSFKSTTKGFSKFCSVKCRLKSFNKETNYIKNTRRSSTIRTNRVTALQKAAEYYRDNDVRVVDVANKFSISYSIIRKLYGL